jgi:peptide/nickel transport system permease protein
MKPEMSRSARRWAGPALRFAASRLVSAALVLAAAMLMLFAITLFVPGDLASVMLGPRATADTRAVFAERMGLDEPIVVRLGFFFSQLLSGDLGTDILTGRPILAMLGEVLPNTLALVATSLVVGFSVGIPLGCFAVLRAGSMSDTALAVLSVALISTPAFVVAIALLLVFSLRLDWLPVTGVGRQGDYLDYALHLVLPAFTLAVGWIGYTARLVRASLLEAMGEVHIRTLRAYGVPERRLVGRYALKLGIIPVVATMGLAIPELIGGAVFVEIIFARPGIGTLLFQSIQIRNYPVVQACVLVTVTSAVLANMLADMVYGLLDPRVRR